MFQDILIHAPYPVHALLGIIQVLGLDTALGKPSSLTNWYHLALACNNYDGYVC
uniref:Uncharacterized protein n=1 Tax=Rhizophora mucronata TaxID=61149 RepID=A0A2P2K5M6_RHIMU